MTKRKLLIATTNEGKVREIRSFLDTLPFELVSLSDLPEPIEPPEETGNSIEENAIIKARYYAEKTGMLSLADDTGLFLPALDGWPGIFPARIGADAQERCRIVLDNMRGEIDRRMTFSAVLALFDPAADTLFCATGSVTGEVLAEMPKERKFGHGYDPIFFLPEKGKTLDELTEDEKNEISHRGQALSKIKYHLQNTYGGNHIVVPIAFVIREGQILMQQRNDPFRPEFHGRWEYPGGKVEFGETVEKNLVREVREETGYDVLIIEQLPYIWTKSKEAETYRYQVYLIPFVCKIVGGEGSFRDIEVLAQSWHAIEEVPSLNLFEGDDAMFLKFMPELKRVIAENNL